MFEMQAVIINDVYLGMFHFFLTATRTSMLTTPPLAVLLKPLSFTIHSRLSIRRSLISTLEEYPFVDWTVRMFF